jgi:hypothetical protein
VDEAEAWATLGVAPGTSPDELRRAFRRRLRQAHPDVAPGDPQAAQTTARLVRAFAVLRHQRRLPAPSPPRPAPGPSASSVHALVEVDGDSLTYPAPPDEVYRRMVAAAEQLGELTYVDPDARLLDTVVTMADGTACSLLASLQGRAQGTEVFLTLEALGREPSPPVEPWVAALAALLAAGPPPLPFFRR